VYNIEGRFNIAKLDAIFNTYPCTSPNKLTYLEIQAMVKANRDAYDLIGRYYNAKHKFKFCIEKFIIYMPGQG
jgi:hypothetical protein